MIKAEIIADSINYTGKRLTTFKLTFPRIILAEFNTHRMFSRNSASSRAIPFEKMVEAVQNNPFIPIAWQKSHKGMQGSEYFTDETFKQRDIQVKYTDEFLKDWLMARDLAVNQAEHLNYSGLTKQICNRLLEPFMWHTVIMTSEEEGLQNFFDLRCPNYQVYENTGKTNENAQILSFRSKKDTIKRCSDLYDLTNIEWFLINKGQAEIHIMALAEAMWDAYNESNPRFLRPGEWHIPFNNNWDYLQLDLIKSEFPSIKEVKCKIAVARCARVSYTVVGEETSTNYLKDLQLFDKLLESRHLSPFEHIAKVPTFADLKYKLSESWAFDMQTGEDIFESDKYVSNFKGWIQYRKIVENYE